MNSQTKNLLLVSLLCAVIAASAVWIYRSRQVEEYEPRLQVQNLIGEALAAETIKALDGKGSVVIVTLEEGESSELDTHAEVFEEALKKTSIKIVRTYSVSGDKSSKYGPGSGMSGRRFAKVVEKYPNVDAIISFVGVPDPDDDEMKELKDKPLPKFLAFTRSPKHLQELLDKKWIQAAVSTRFQFPAPGPEKPKTPQQWFDKNFQIVRLDTPAGTLN